MRGQFRASDQVSEVSAWFHGFGGALTKGKSTHVVGFAAAKGAAD